MAPDPGSAALARYASAVLGAGRLGRPTVQQHVVHDDTMGALALAELQGAGKRLRIPTQRLDEVERHLAG